MGSTYRNMRITSWNQTRSYSISSMNVFDRELKKKQRTMAAMLSNSREYDYLRDEVAKRLVDRLDVSLQSWRF